MKTHSGKCQQCGKRDVLTTSGPDTCACLVCERCGNGNLAVGHCGVCREENGIVDPCHDCGHASLDHVPAWPHPCIAEGGCLCTSWEEAL